MNFHTIDQGFEYQMIGIVKQVIAGEEFTNGDNLDEFLYNHKLELGELFYQVIGEWMTSDELLEKAKE